MNIPAPRMGMGTWGMGGRSEPDESNRQESIEALKLGISLGLTIIDTAEYYGGGLTEEIVGEAIAETPREEIFLISKIWQTHLRRDDVPRALEGSLKRLGTPYLDLYLIHWPSDTIPLSETIPAMEALVDQGLARAIGVSNFSVAQMEEASRHLKNTVLAANQIEYSVANQEARRTVIPYCEENNIDVIAYRPLARGSLARERQESLEMLGKEYSKTPAQIALGWLLSQDIVPIPASRNLEHVRENAGAIGFTMDTKDVESLYQ